MTITKKTGYLHQQLKLFYLADQQNWVCPYHYHDFDKITIFLQGSVTYDIEGTSYSLQPYDVVIIPAGQLHRPVVSDSAIYERIIAYVSPEFFEAYSSHGCDLSIIFKHIPSQVLRQPQEMGSLFSSTCRLRQAFATTGMGKNLLEETIFLEFMIHLARAMEKKNVGYVRTRQANEKIQEIMSYITTHLTEPLSVPILAYHFYISPDYLMHLFKNETGYAVAQYITAKRLILARSLIEKGKPLTSICYDSGFKNYSTFYRAWKQFYHTSPRQGTKRMDDPRFME